MGIRKTGSKSSIWVRIKSLGFAQDYNLSTHDTIGCIELLIIIQLITMHKSLELLQPREAKTLRKIYEEFSSRDNNFPWNCCKSSSIRIHEELGYDLIIGAFALDKAGYNPWEGRTYMATDHAFTQNNSGYVIDMTASQFNPWMNQEIPQGILVITPDDELYQRYVHVPGNPPHLHFSHPASRFDIPLSFTGWTAEQEPETRARELFHQYLLNRLPKLPVSDLETLVTYYHGQMPKVKPSTSLETTALALTLAQRLILQKQL